MLLREEHLANGIAELALPGVESNLLINPHSNEIRP